MSPLAGVKRTDAAAGLAAAGFASAALGAAPIPDATNPAPALRKKSRRDTPRRLEVFDIFISVTTLTALVTVGFPFDGQPPVKSQVESAVESSGSHNRRRGSNG